MKRIVIVAFIAGIFAACSKDKFESVPRIEIKEFGPEEVQKGQVIRLTANIFDQEGDLQDTLYVYRRIFNANTNAELSVDSLITSDLKTLGAPSKQETEVLITLLYGEQDPRIGPTQNGDGIDRKFSIGLRVKDKAGNKSEYVESNKIILKKI